MIEVHSSITLDDFMITKWWLVHVDAQPLAILGPKCHSSACHAPARVVVWLPTAAPEPPRYCEPCAEWALEVYRTGLGFGAIRTQRMDYRPASEDDAVQRAAMMEME